MQDASFLSCGATAKKNNKKSPTKKTKRAELAFVSLTTSGKTVGPHKSLTSLESLAPLRAVVKEQSTVLNLYFISDVLLLIRTKLAGMPWKGKDAHSTESFRGGVGKEVRRVYKSQTSLQKVKLYRQRTKFDRI